MANKPGLQWHLIKSMWVVIAICILAGVMLHLAKMSQMVHPEDIQDWLANKGLLGWPLLFLGAAGLMLLGFPRQVIAFIAGSLLGVVSGALVSTLAAALSCFVGFVLARYFLQNWVLRKFPALIKRLHPLLQGKPFVATLAIRLLPVGSNALTNVVAGASTIPGRWFVSASALGYLPQMLTFALMGQGVEQLSTWQLAISFSLFICAAVLGLHVYRWYQQQPCVSATQD